MKEKAMLDTVKTKAVATKNFVKKHRVAIAVAATSTVWFALQVRTASEFNEFLKEHDLFDEYYAEEDPAELEALKA
jgi:hypothetical protein